MRFIQVKMLPNVLTVWYAPKVNTCEGHLADR